MWWSHRRAGRQRWADLTQPVPEQPGLEQMRTEAAALADVLREPTVVLESGVRIPAWLVPDEEAW